MNFYDYVKQELVRHGMFESQATTVIALAAEDEAVKSLMTNRWGDDIDGYPQGLAANIFHLVKPVAYKWICENIPRAWFRAVFSPGVEGLSGDALNKYLDEYHHKVQLELSKKAA